jgi:hypothetical protein
VSAGIAVAALVGAVLVLSAVAVCSWTLGRLQGYRLGRWQSLGLRRVRHVDDVLEPPDDAERVTRFEPDERGRP